jgi:hypothetical protein
MSARLAELEQRCPRAGCGDRVRDHSASGCLAKSDCASRAYCRCPLTAEQVRAAIRREQARRPVLYAD